MTTRELRADAEWRERHVLWELERAADIGRARDEGRKEGRAEGRKEGRAEGLDEAARLVARLFAEGREDDLRRAADDPAFRDALIKEYGLAKGLASE